MAANPLQEQAAEQKIQALRFQNVKLSEQLENYKQQIAALETTISKHELASKERADTLMCINRLWDELNKDIAHLCQRSGLADSAAADAGDPAEVSGLEGISDPYLRRLLCGDPQAIKKVQADHKSMLDDFSDAEKVLVERSNSTKDALSKLLAHLQQLPPSSMPVNDDPAKHLQQQLDATKALQRSTEALLKQADDRLYEAEENMKQVKNDLADKEYEMQALQRKLMRAKQDAAAQGGKVAAAAGAAPGPSAGSSSAAAAAAATNKLAGVGGDVEEMQERLRELQQMLELRNTEIEKEQQAHQKAAREVVELQARLSEEGWVASTVTYQSQRKELGRLVGELEARQKEVDKLLGERDDMARQLGGHNQTLEVKLLLEKRLAAATAQVAELQQKQVEVLAAKHKVEQALLAEKGQVGRQQTVEELKAMIMALHKEVDAREGQLRKHQVSGQRVDAALSELSAARAQVSSYQVVVDLLQARLRAKTQDMVGVGIREQQLQERINDQQAFIEVISSYMMDPRDVVEVRKSERELNIKLQQMQQQLQGSDAAAKLHAAQEVEVQLRQACDAAHATVDELRGDVAGLQQQVEELQQQVGKVREETVAYVKEIGDANEAYEAMQEQNTRLLQQATERDSHCHDLLAQKLALEQQLEALKEQMLSMKADAGKMMAEAGALTALKEAVEKDFAKVTAELAAAREQLRGQASTLDRLSRDLRAKEEERLGLAALLEKEREISSSKGRRLEEEEAALVKERSKRQRLEGEYQAAQSNLERLRAKSASGSDDVMLKEENEALHKLIRCSVCHSANKEVIITKCWHMFCQGCIKKNLEARHRKCPGCGHPFGAADVKQFYFT